MSKTATPNPFANVIPVQRPSTRGREARIISEDVKAFFTTLLPETRDDAKKWSGQAVGLTLPEGLFTRTVADLRTLADNANVTLSVDYPRVTTEPDAEGKSKVVPAVGVDLIVAGTKLVEGATGSVSVVLQTMRKIRKPRPTVDATSDAPAEAVA